MGQVHETSRVERLISYYGRATKQAFKWPELIGELGKKKKKTQKKN